MKNVSVSVSVSVSDPDPLTLTLALTPTILDRGLERARSSPGWTLIALPAPVVAPAALVAAFRSGPLVAWAARDRVIVGIGAAHELRGCGEARWDELIASARRMVVGGDARAILLGGLAFAPGSADRAPWTGFGDAWFALPRWTYSHDGATGRLVLAVDASDARHAARWHDERRALESALDVRFAPRPQPPMRELAAGDAEDWRTHVRAITDAIARGEHEKIVAARAAIVTLAGEVRAADLLAELDARHGDCVRVLVRPPGGGALIAATPERLVRKRGAHVECDALAGSHPPNREPGGLRPNGGEDAEALLASAKDRREHELVVRAIRAALHELGEVSAPTEPTVRALRHVLHLHTPIAATLHEHRHVLEVAARLHPTPAVGGTPTRTATAWIEAREPVPRGWYAAPVGWFDLDGDGELAVAIRSGLLAGERAHLWAGAGIVAGSDPDRELAETELKLRAMLGALGVPA
jgi:menaquinone-specific isochorismate synthase